MKRRVPDLRPPVTLDRVRDAIVRCAACPRLRNYCREVARERRAMFRTERYWGRPVPGFGDPDAELLIVGLAPAAHGGNRTGRVFTGDDSGNFLMAALHRTGFANQPYSRDRNDGLRLKNAYVLAVVRCAPPGNRPLPTEIERCRVHLLREIDQLPKIRVALALGKIAHDGFLAGMRERGWTPVRGRPRPAFGHGAAHDLGPGLPRLFDSYHPSRQNTNTGRLTPAMLDSVLDSVRDFLQRPA